MIARINTLIIIFLLCCVSLTRISWGEPFIVLQFNSQDSFTEGNGTNAFSIDPLHSEYYTVKSGDSLTSILKSFYNGSGLDRRFVQLAIVIANPKAFAKNNPNFLFSKKKIYLPGKSDIEKLLIGKSPKKLSADNYPVSSNKNIYFFGG